MFRRPRRSESATDADPSGRGPGAAAGTEQRFIRDAERRSLWRLLQRRRDLQFDLERSEDAFLPDNSWTERIEQLDAAIAQAVADLKTLDAPPATRPNASLPPTPIEIAEAHVAEPASIVLRTGEVSLVYREELDWAERGHTIALPELLRQEGDVLPLIPEALPEEQRDALITHLRDSFAIVAEEALERADQDQPLPTLTLADITQPCERCGGWIDPKGRCPACAERDRLRQRLLADTERLRAERDSTRREMERSRERLPVVRRQIAEIDLDIDKLRAKGVEPEAP